MASDEIIWGIIDKQFCSYKLKSVSNLHAKVLSCVLFPVSNQLQSSERPKLLPQ